MRHSEFLAEHLGEWPGPIVDQDTGAVLGYHRGFWFHTIGQRKGVRFVSFAPAQVWRLERTLCAALSVSTVHEPWHGIRPAVADACLWWLQIPLHGGPWYCVSKDARMNTVYVSREYFSDDKTRDTFRRGK